MKIKKPLLIVLGEPNSIFIEILSKVLNKITFKKKKNYPIILIGSKKLILSQLKSLKKKLSFEIINEININNAKLKNKIYLIDIQYNFKKPFEKISFKYQQFNSYSQCLDSIC